MDLFFFFFLSNDLFMKNKGNDAAMILCFIGSTPFGRKPFDRNTFDQKTSVANVIKLFYGHKIRLFIIS
jgi:hypothetical protein